MKNFKFDIRNKTLFSIIISIILFSFIFLSIKTYITYLKDLKNYETSIKNREINTARNASLLLSEMLNPSKILLVNTAKQLETRNINNNNEVTSFLTEKALKFTGIEGIYFGRESDGSFFGSKDYNLPEKFDPRNRPWYKGALQKNGFIITEPYIDVSTGAQCLGLAVPVYSNGIFTGVLGADLPVTKISDILDSIVTEQKIHYSLLTSLGTPIILPEYMNVYSYMSTIINKNINSIKSNASGEIFIDNGKSKIYAYYLNIPSFEFKLLAMADPEDYNIKKDNLVKSTLLGSGMQALFLTILGLSVIALFNFMKQRELNRLLYRDVLTGLSNRNYLELVFLTMQAKRITASKHALMLIDIDNFKFINDTLGHETGDIVLKSIVSILKKLNSKDTLITRIGSDEFALLIKNTSKEKAVEVAKIIQRHIFDTPIFIGDNQVDLSISIGLTMVESDFEMQKYMSLADVALRMAKEEGKNRVICLLHDDSTAADIQQMERINKTINTVKNALKNDKFLLYLQPIIELDSNTVSHYEALIRLKGDDNKFIPPSDFIPVAEKFGFVSEIDKWVFKTVLNILAENTDMKIFINLSAISLSDNSLLEYMEESLKLIKSSNSEFRLGIEITETAASKNFSISENWINKFKEMGCLIAIDDFGVGYTSFSYLRSLPVDYIKIDGSLIKNIDSDKDFEAIVQAINKLGEVLNKRIIAEYVENESVMAVLKKIGVFYGQGYFLGLPAPLNEYII